MYKKTFIFIILLLSLVLLSPFNVKAYSTDDLSFFNDIYILYDDDEITTDEYEYGDVDDGEYYEVDSCDSDSSILGNVNDENSVAWLLQQVLNYVKVIGPALVVILSSIDFITVIAKGDDDSMAKAKKKLITRLVLALCLFFIPVFVSAILDIFGFTSNATCGLS